MSGIQKRRMSCLPDLFTNYTFPRGAATALETAIEIAVYEE
jgi:hypothetical protein